MDSCDIINGAIDILNDKPWIQGHYGDDFIGYCLVGALHTAYLDTHAKNYDSYHEAYDKIARVAKTKFLPAWNDNPGRTKDEVIAVLKEACA